MKELWGEHYFMEQASPEVRKAQLEAERRNLSEYRQRWLKNIIEWSDPAKREAKIEAYKRDEAEARKMLKDIPADLIAVRTKPAPFTQVKLRTVYEFVPRDPTKWEKFKKWFSTLIA